LQVLEESGWVRTEKLGTVRTYRVEPGRPAITDQGRRPDRLNDLFAKPKEHE
jgi:hypothetical protein